MSISIIYGCTDKDASNYNPDATQNNLSCEYLQTIPLKKDIYGHKDFEANIVLGIAHIVNKSFPHGYIRTALGAFYNHSDTPNCTVLNGYWHQIPVKYLMTSCSIKAGEELTATYSLYTINDLSWE